MPEEPYSFIPQEQQFIHEARKCSSVVWLLRFLGALLIGVFLTVCAGYFYIGHLNHPPADFPVNQAITITPGMDVRSITALLANAGVVQSSTLLYYLLILSYDPTSIKASSYMFDTPLSTYEVANRITQGDFDTDLIRFTHIEGERVSLLAARAAQSLPNFDSERFLANATSLEGRLFPETYFIPESYTDIELLDLILRTFDENIAPIQDAIDTSYFSLDEILILASILEREANSSTSMKMVSGILQNRLEIGMALQADATIEYVVETPLGKLPEGQLASELRELDSPYNTYLHPGLPPTPIGNPGLEAITAVLQPTVTENFYYITDEDGMFHYSKTYQEHLRNIEHYLR